MSRTKTSIGVRYHDELSSGGPDHPCDETYELPNGHVTMNSSPSGTTGIRHNLAMSAVDPVNESQTQIRRVDAALGFTSVYARLFAESFHGEQFFRLSGTRYLVGNGINTEGGWVSRDRLRWSENSGLLALKLFDCERTAVTQLNKSLELTG